MGNTCQTNQDLALSVNLTDYFKSQERQSQIINLPKIKPIILPYYGKYPPHPPITKHQKRGCKRLSNLSIQVETWRAQIKTMRTTLKQIQHILTLDLNLPSYSQDYGRQFINFIASLKRFNKTSNLQINYANLPYESWKKFCFALKHLQNPKKLQVNFNFSRYTQYYKPGPFIRAIQKSRDLREFCVNFLDPEKFKPKSIDLLLSSLKIHSKLQTLSLKFTTMTMDQENAFNKGMKNLKNLKLSSLNLDLIPNENTDVFKDLPDILVNFASSLKRLSLRINFHKPAPIKVKPQNHEIFSQFLAKLSNLSHLFLEINPPDEPFGETFILSLINGLKSIKNLPRNFKVGLTYNQQGGENTDQQHLLDLYQKLVSPNWKPSIQISLNQKNEHKIYNCYLENLQPYSPGLSIDFKASDRVDDLVSLLNQVSFSTALTLDFSKLDIIGLKRTFDSLKKFTALTNITIIFTRCYQIDKKWIETLFDLLTQLPSSVNFLKLKFIECVQMSSQEIQLVIFSIAKLRKMTGFGLAFEDIVQFTNENGIELGKELKQLEALKYLDLSFKGCFMLKDQGVLSILESVKTLSCLQEVQVKFEECWDIGQSTVDRYQIDTKGFSVKFQNYKKNV